MTLVAGSEWHRVFGWGPIRWRVLPVAILPVVLGWFVDATFRRFDGFRNWGSPLPVAVLISLLSLVLWMAATSTFGSLGTGLIDGWAKLLHQPLPSPAAPDLLVLPTVTLWIAALTGGELVLRVTRPVVAVLPPLAAYGLAVLFGIGGGGSRLWPSALFLIFGLAFAGAAAWSTSGATAGRSAAAAAARPLGGPGRLSPGLAVTGRRVAEVAGCAAVAALLAVWIGPSLPGVGGHRPYDPHTPEIPLSQSATELLNPLANLSAWAGSPNQVLYNLRASRPVDLRLAVLDAYDPGIGWSLSPANRFRVAGKDIAGGSGGRDKVAVSQQVTIEDSSGRWLPSADRPVQITGINALVEPHSGILLARVPAASSTRYQVRSVVPASPPSCRLSAVGHPSGPSVVIPTELSNLAQSLTTGTTAPCARAQALATGLRDAYKFDAKAPSGSNIQILRNFLIGSADNKGGQGTSEQFASAFALLGRALSLPTRVVVGFHGATTGPLKAGDAQAWPEVNFAGVGWVAFDPTPAQGQASHPDKPIEGSTSGSQSKVNPSGTGPQPVEATPRLPALRRHHRAGPWGTVGLVVAIVVGAALVLLLVLVGVVALVRQRRRLSRQRAADSRARVLGAWKESLDNLSDAGVAAEPAFTASQVVEASAGRLSGSAQRDLADLGSLVNSAVYGPVPPDDATVNRAWADADRLAEAARAELTAKDRFRRAVDVTVLVRSRL